MRFRQLDKITKLVPGVRLEAEKTLTGREDYLRDHFPRFPVQPGVLMLESLFQAAQILVRATQDYQPGLVVLREARNIKFASFLQPGQTLIVEVEIMKQSGSASTVKALGKNSNGEICVAGRFVIDVVSDDPQNSQDIHAGRYMRELASQLQQAAMADKIDGYNLVRTN